MTSSVSGMADPSDTVAGSLVAAAKHDSAIVMRRVVAGDAWGGCHLVSHWLPGIRVTVFHRDNYEVQSTHAE